MRVEAVDGKKMDADPAVKEILKPRQDLIGTSFYHHETQEGWTYDGTASTSFPCLEQNGHWGTKGLTLSNMKAFLKFTTRLQTYQNQNLI